MGGTMQGAQVRGSFGLNSREEAQRVLNEVRTRYGIPSIEQQRTFVPVPSTASRVQRQQPPQPAIDFRRAMPNPVPEVQPFSSETPLDMEWMSYASGSMHHATTPAEVNSFHYLIRIAECTQTLHCEIHAASAAEARERLGKIRNLLDWREVSARELAEITGNPVPHPAGVQAVPQTGVSGVVTGQNAASSSERW